MPYNFSTVGFAIVAALTVGPWSIANADSSFKVVTVPTDARQVQKEGLTGSSFRVVTAPTDTRQVHTDTTVVPHADESLPEERPTVAGRQPSTKEIEIKPGYLETINLDWSLRDVHIGDSKIIDAFPVSDKKLLVQGKENGRTTLYVTGESGDKFASYEVIVDPLPGSKKVEIHNSKELVNSTTFDCDKKSGCGYPEVHEIKKEDLPKGYSNTKQDVEQRMTQTQQKPE